MALYSLRCAEETTLSLIQLAVLCKLCLQRGKDAMRFSFISEMTCCVLDGTLNPICLLSRQFMFC